MQEETQVYEYPNGVKVRVKKAVYLTLSRTDWREEKRKQLMWRCPIPVKSEDGSIHYVRCKKKCIECEYWLAGNNPCGSNISMEGLAEEGGDIEDKSLSAEERIVDGETKQEETSALYAALAKLVERDRQIIEMLFFEKKTQEEVAEILGISKARVCQKRKEILEKLKKFFKNP